MFSHVCLGANDVPAAKKLYGAGLAAGGTDEGARPLQNRNNVQKITR